jgi:CheY-like chemotaxis protein
MSSLKPVMLIVEDEYLLRMDSVEVLEGAGFEVIPVANADEAIAILSARSDIHLVFTDIQMPGSMDGLKLAQFVRDRWPPIKIVATSGHVRTADEDLPAGSVFIPKPYSGAQLISTLRDLTGIA